MLDLRLTNATVLTMDPAHPVARQLGIWQGRIVGLDDEVSGLPARRVIDLAGATVLPGFVDAHVHLAWAGLAERSPDLSAATGVDQVLAVVREAALRVPVGEWVDLVGYDQRRLGRHLNATELDQVAAGRKLFVIHDSGHACAVNSAVLELLPASVQHQDGVLTESGMAAVRALRMPYSIAELVEAIVVAWSGTARWSWPPTSRLWTRDGCRSGCRRWSRPTPCARSARIRVTASTAPSTWACAPAWAGTGSRSGRSRSSPTAG
jgi:predicted amidohydrolase YtcJ